MNIKQSIYLFVAIAAIFAGPSFLKAADVAPVPPAPAVETSVVSQIEESAKNVVVARVAQTRGAGFCGQDRHGARAGEKRPNVLKATISLKRR
jgi:hypothetical protein